MRFSKISLITADEGDQLFEVSYFVGIWSEGYAYLGHEQFPSELKASDSFLEVVYPFVVTLFGDADEEFIIEFVCRGGQDCTKAENGLYFKTLYGQPSFILLLRFYILL